MMLEDETIFLTELEDYDVIARKLRKFITEQQRTVILDMLAYIFVSFPSPNQRTRMFMETDKEKVTIEDGCFIFRRVSPEGKNFLFTTPDLTDVLSIFRYLKMTGCYFRGIIKIDVEPLLTKSEINKLILTLEYLTQVKAKYEDVSLHYGASRSLLVKDVTERVGISSSYSTARLFPALNSANDDAAGSVLAIRGNPKYINIVVDRLQQSDYRIDITQGVRLESFILDVEGVKHTVDVIDYIENYNEHTRKNIIDYVQTQVQEDPKETLIKLEEAFKYLETFKGYPTLLGITKGAW